MRNGFWQALAFAAAVPALCAADPPSDAGKKREELQDKLLKALERINDRGPAPPPMPAPPPVAPTGPKAKAPEGPLDGPQVDEIKAGTTAYRDNQFEAARLVFAGIDATGLPREDRAFVRYMLACSLRRLGKVGEAETIYREVANSGDDEFLGNCAVWQLALLKSNRELETQLGELRSRAKSK